MARWTARRRGKPSTADDEDTEEERAVNDESEDERELRLEVEVLLA